MCLCPLPWSNRGEVVEVLSHRSSKMYSSRAFGDDAGGRARGEEVDREEEISQSDAETARTATARSERDRERASWTQERTCALAQVCDNTNHKQRFSPQLYLTTDHRATGKNKWNKKQSKWRVQEHAGRLTQDGTLKPRKKVLQSRLLVTLARCATLVYACCTL